MVKITGSQRIDLLGVKKSDLPKIWADLGMPSGQAYTKGVRMVKTCVGTDFCRFGVQDSTSAGIELERRLENLYTPHKVKMGAVGCPRNCAEATVKDIGTRRPGGSWQVVVGGAAGKSVRKADLLITVETTEEALQAARAVLPVLPRKRQLSGAHLRFRRAGRNRESRRETVYAPLSVQQGLLERLHKSKRLSRDAWLEGDEPRHPTQFVQIEPLEKIINERNEKVGAHHRCENIPLREGRAVKIGDHEVAIFNLGDRFWLLRIAVRTTAARSLTASSRRAQWCARCTRGR